MKTYGNLYEKLCCMENLRLAYKKVRKGKSNKWYTKEFESDLENNLLKLKQELQNLTYEPRPLRTFVIRDPKSRVISASAFRDRVVHHALCNIIEPISEKMFIFDSYANRKGKGTHAAIKRFDEFKRKVSRNGRLVNGAKFDSMVIGYVLKADIRHYFQEVNHCILLGMLKRKIQDEKILRLIQTILDNHKTFGKGMAIGNLTSQFFANVYLNELDYFVKHTLRAKYYIRYVDDFVILERSKEKLEFYKNRINEFLKGIKLELHPEKSKIYPLHKGVTFLGFRIFYYHKLLKKSNMKHFMKRLGDFSELHSRGEISSVEIEERVDGWLAYATHGNTYRLRENIISRLGELMD
ncbi:MAG: hypothetical protein HYT72_00005 [Candidatus Aenigmarchaeota archaeon]|nr:hypothetical protein [Candidatus Aenigmarchaeota archaeon]